MLRKIYILSFIIIFFASNIGFPIALHFCEMMNIASLSSCTLCEEKNENPVSCCDTTSEKNNQTISKIESGCCKEIINETSITDSYIYQQKKDESFSVNFQIIFTSIVDNNDISSTYHFYKNKIPLFIQENPKYILNTSFLI